MKNHFYKLLFTCIICIFQSLSFAQKDSVQVESPVMELTGFADIYYAYDFNQPQTNYRQTFFYNHNRHQEFNINLAYLKLCIDHSKYRANLALHAGTYANDNYANEPGLLKGIFEANAGIAFNKNNDLWIDAGVLPSHIGFESAISIDNWNLTRSILAENSPYYLSGVKLTYTPGVKWELATLVCNGWQRIQKVQGNSLPSFGTQIRFTPDEKTMINWSTFIGTDDPDSTRRMRYFNNLYGQFLFSDRFGLIVGFDIGVQEHLKNNSKYDSWWGAAIIGRFAFDTRWSAAFRAEYFDDKTGIIIPSTTPNGFQTTSLSLNIDYSPFPKIACRIEGRWLGSKDNIFEYKGKKTDTNVFVVGSIAIEI